MAALAIQGTTSWAGKSLLTTALCRLFARRGVRVAPFKAQNMSNNARVIDGGEIGVAQYLQALAAGVTPDVRMNPVLVKPEADTRSQVVLLGRVDRRISALPWRDRGPELWGYAEESLRSLLDEFELVVIEGAGSPAEINLRGSDLANMRAALFAAAPVILVSDIDRGGAFAHLYGTWALLAPEERALVRGFVLNRFRGDPGLLSPGPEQLETLTGVPTIGVVPMLDHGLPDEDGAAQPAVSAGRARVAVVRYPAASNLDEYKLLEQAAAVVFATTPDELDEADLVILPGSKNVSGDLAWLVESGIAGNLRERVQTGRRVLGICGGLMMLGRALDDRGGVDGSAPALGVLPITTAFERDKVVRRTESRFVDLPALWTTLSRLPVAGYEIRHGRLRGAADAVEALPDGLGFVRGSILGVAAHGLLESPAIVAALVGRRPARTLEDELDRLADAVEPHLRVDALLELALAPA